MLKKNDENTDDLFFTFGTATHGLVVRDPVKFKKVHPDAKIPSKQHEHDACWDLYSVERVTLKSMEIRAIDTGLQMEMAPYLEATIRPRSGLALLGLTIITGTIDSGYRGNIKVIMINLSQERQDITVGGRIAQMQFGLTQHVDFMRTVELDDSERGTGGFGSTGN